MIRDASVTGLLHTLTVIALSSSLVIVELFAISERYEIRGIPLLVLSRDGAEVDRQVGAVPPEQLRQWLNSHLATPGGHKSIDEHYDVAPAVTGSVADVDEPSLPSSAL